MCRNRKIQRLTAGLLVLALFVALSPLAALPAQAAPPAQMGGSSVFINEIHYDNTGTDAGEAIEIAGPAGTDLSGWSLVLYNGSGGTPYNTTLLSGVIPDQQNGFGTVALDYPTNGIQNGSPDGIALVDAGATVIQFLSYEGSFTAVGGPADGMSSTDIAVSEPSDTPVGFSLQLGGMGTTYGDFAWAGPTANTLDAVNSGQTFQTGTPSAALVINEIDYDQPSTDTAEFIEIVNVGPGTANLGDYTLELVNGTGGGAAVYNTIDLPDVDLGPGEYFVVCGDAANVANCDLDVTPDSNLIQNGAPDAVALRQGDELVDAVSYEGDSGAPYTEGSGAGLVDDADEADMGISRCPDGSDTDQNNVDLSLRGITPGAANECALPAPNVVINEVDADQVSTDSAEFIELYDGGTGNTALDGLILVLFNGSDDASYLAFDLDGQSTDAGGYFVLCGDAGNVANCDLDVSPDTDLIQNGADAVALYVGDAVDFPNDTAVTTTGLVDAIVYDTDDADDPGLLVLLNAGQPQVNERGGGDGTGHSNQRCPNGEGGARNTDTYAQFSPTPGEENTCGTGFGACGDPATLVHDVQGSGSASPLAGTTVIVEAVVVGDFQTSSHLRGFFLQEEDADVDADPLTSEGLFVYDGSAPAVDVNVGDVVRVEGSVAEYYDLTELTGITNIAVCDPGAATAATVVLPVSSLDEWEQYEGMLIHIPGPLYVTGNYTQGRYGEVDLSVGQRLDQPTNVVAPGAPAIALQDLNDRSRIQLEDGSTAENPSPAPYIGPGNTLRAGDTTPELTGVLNYGFGQYEVHPTKAVSFDRANPRDATPPDAGGTLEVASFNVLNYFTTLDNSGPICGPSGGMDCRGADSEFEFERQRTKIIAAIVEMDADVIGLMEMENHPADAALQDLVNGLNDEAGAGTYDYVSTGPIGSDAIKVALIYKPGTVTPAGPFAILDSSVDPTFIDTMNRPALAQTFEQNATGARLTVVVNHLKSKSSACDDIGDPDIGDGQGNCNLTRTSAAIALVNWLATDPTGSGDPDYLIIGDLNAYAMEDPITAIKDAGYTNLIESWIGPYAYSYVYSGQAGIFDHALANDSLAAQVEGVVEWHINADEPTALDYNDYNQPELYAPDPYRASDHDPVLVGLELNAPPDCSQARPSVDTIWSPNHEFVAIDILGVTDPDGDTFEIAIESIFQDEAVDATGDGRFAPDGQGVGTATAEVRAERAGSGNGRVYHIRFSAQDTNGNTCLGEVLVGVPKSQGVKGAAVDDGPLYDSTVP